jgi:hypothetical protein
MRHALLAATAAIGLLAGLSSSANATLVITATDNGTPITLTTTSTGAGQLTANGSDANFTSVNVNASGAPQIPDPALGTTTLDVQHGGTGSDTLLITIDQTGLSGITNFNSQTEMTTNGLIGAPGPSTLSMLVNGVLLDTHTFPASSTAQTQAFTDSSAGPILSDAQTYSIVFTGAQAALDTISFVAVGTPTVSEPGSLALLGAGLVGTGFVVRRRRRGVAALP